MLAPGGPAALLGPEPRYPHAAPARRVPSRVVPAPPAPAEDTAARSLAHWSEAGRAEMEAFYALAWLDYRLLAEALDTRGLFARLRARRPAAAPLRLLDVACGSGKFPQALAAHADLSALAGTTVDYELLDPSPFALSEAASVLRPPFLPGTRHQVTLQALDPGVGRYDVVWTTHALYAMPPADAPAAMARLVAALAPDGLGIVAHGAPEGHYLRVYEAYRAALAPGVTRYTGGDDLIAGLRAAGARPRTRRLRYEHVVAAADRAVLQGFLQRCLFDDALTLPEMLSAPVLGDYLAGCHDPVADTYRFAQEVDLIVLSIDEGEPWTAGS